MIYFIVDKEQEKEISGVSFDGITSNWTSTYKVKIGTMKNVKVQSFCNYDNENDKKSLRDYLFAEIIVKETKEIKSKLVKYEGLEIVIPETKVKTKTKKVSFRNWKTFGLNLGTFRKDRTYEVEIIFSTEELPENCIGSESKFDFEFGILE
jgi:hypothetical protein